MVSKNVHDFICDSLENEIYNKTINGKCSQCGECCSNFLPMNEQEIETIRKYVKKHNIKEYRHLFPTVFAPSYDFTCPFLDSAKPSEKCMIYEVRPMICRKFICDSKQRAILTRDEISKTRRIVDVRHEFYGTKSFV